MSILDNHVVLDADGIIMARNTTLLVFVLSAIVSSSSAFAPVTTKRANLYNVAARKEKELHVNRFQNGPLQEPRISLNMVATEVAVGAIAGTVSGGLFSGGLHAIAGKLVVSCRYII